MDDTYLLEEIPNTLFSIAELITVPEKRESKHKFEYQELCSELAPIYGSGIWTLPHRVGFTEYKIRLAHQKAMERGITTLGYLIGIVKKLP